MGIRGALAVLLCVVACSQAGRAVKADKSDKAFEKQVLAGIYELTQKDETVIRNLVEKYKCQSAYLDVGTNIGVQIRKLFEPQKYKSSKVRAIFDKYYGKSRCNVCAFGFEPNPRHSKRLDGLQSKLRDAGAAVHIFQAAASDNDGLARFIYPSYDKYGWQGANIIGSRHGHRPTTRAVIVNVRTLDLARIVRVIREAMDNNGGERGNILAKIDIEGAEYAVLPHLLHQDVLCKEIDGAYIEWHAGHFAHVDNVTRKVTPKIPMDNHFKELKAFFAGGSGYLNKGGVRKTRMITLDDNTHMLDKNMTWPSPGEICNRGSP